MSANGSSSRFKNYSINAIIVLLIVITFYLSYSFIKHTTGKKQDAVTEVLDSTKNVITHQPAGSTLQIDIQNGSGVQGLGNKFMDFLRTYGFDVVEKGDYPSSDEKTSFVIDRAGNLKNAKRVAKALGISEKNVISQVNKDYFLDATVVIGKDYNELSPFKQK